MILFFIIVLEAMIMIGLVEYREYSTKKAEQESQQAAQEASAVQQVKDQVASGEEMTTMAQSQIQKRDENASADACSEDGKRIVCLDPALGGYAKGNTSKTDSGMSESEYNLEFAKLIQQELTAQNVLVYMTREESVNLDDEERTDLANNVYADLMVTLNRESYNGKDSNSGISAWVHHKRPKTSDYAAQMILDALEDAGAKVNQVDAGTANSVSEDYPTNKECIGPSLVLGMGSVLNEDDITDYEKNKEVYAKAVAEAIVDWMDDQGL